MTTKKDVVKANSGKRKRGYGWVPDIPDQRDYLLSTILRIPARLPSSVDLRSACSTVEDQGQLGSCTANALAGALECLENHRKVDAQEGLTLGELRASLQKAQEYLDEISRLCGPKI